MSNIDYLLIRSNRKTLSISIKNNSVIVRAPLRMSVSKIEDFIKQKSGWITKHLADNSKPDLLSGYKNIYVKGKLLPLVVGEEISICGDCVCVRKISDIKKLYISQFGDEFMQQFKEISQACGLKASNVQFKSYKARWGCCDSKKNIVFNFKLLMLPTELWKCVIVHELCHTVFMDHSKNFHALACTVMPDYAYVHKKLKNYSDVCRLY